MNDNEMKPMVYTNEELEDVLYEGEYKRYKFVILSFGSHPMAFVENKLGIINDEDIRLMDINVHGDCFTWFYYGFWDEESKKTTWLGWSYGYYDEGDCWGACKKGSYKYEHCKMWTTPEIYEEVKNVVEQLIEVENNQPKIDAVRKMLECVDHVISDVYSAKRVCEELYAAGYRKQSEVAKGIRDKIETQGRFEFCGADGKEYLTIRADKLNEIIKAAECGVEVKE